jgi:outer membrane protein OmpA-like peptidoglycan-associated protein
MITVPLPSKMTFLVVGFISVTCLGNSAFAQLVSREEIVRALIAKPLVTRSLTSEPRRYDVTTFQSDPTIDLREIYFEFNSAAITESAGPQMRELGAALKDPRLNDSRISISGHTDGVGGLSFNQALSERRAAAVKRYLVDNFGISPERLHTAGYGKLRLKNKADVYAPENRRVEIINEVSKAEGGNSESRRR